MEKETIGLCCDHAGYGMKEHVKNYLDKKGLRYKDFGTYSEERCDYPDFAHLLGRSIEQGELSAGIAVCGSGNGISMTLNKYPKVRAALCWDKELAMLGRAHNDANVLSIPGRFVSENTAEEMVDAFLDTPFEGGRHTNRVQKIPIH